PVLSIAGEEKMRAALEGLELLVCVDIYRNATAEYADYILPAAGAFEREDINITGIGLQFSPSVQFTPAIVAPAGDRKPDWWIYEQLCRQLGFESAFDHDEAPDMWARVDAMLRSRGESMANLRARDILTFERSTPESFYEQHLQTDDQQIDCFPSVFADALERMAEICVEFESAPPDQLRLISKRDAYMMNSWYSNLPKMKRKDRDRNYLFMHPEDARVRQIAEGAEVVISNRFGSIEAPVKLSDEVMPGVVAMTHGWGHAQSRGMSFANSTPGVNCNVLLPSGPGSFEPLSNQAHMTGVPVTVALTRTDGAHRESLVVRG
ncbi:MAG: molybdopterin dinucleotide binding domain-containing protein, partial [Pseudomonadales bacterium]